MKLRDRSLCECLWEGHGIDGGAEERGWRRGPETGKRLDWSTGGETGLRWEGLLHRNRSNALTLRARAGGLGYRELWEFSSETGGDISVRKRGVGSEA